MEILNEENQYKVKFFKIVLFVLLSTAIAILYATRFFDNNFPAIKKDYFLIIFISIYIIINFIRFLRKYSYFYFDDNTPNLTFRFFHLVPFSSKKLAFSIPKKAFYDFRVEKKMFGLQHNLILLQRNNKRIVTYPPISLSAVSKNDKEKLFNRLQVLKINK